MSEFTTHGPAEPDSTKRPFFESGKVMITRLIESFVFLALFVVDPVLMSMIYHSEFPGANALLLVMGLSYIASFVVITVALWLFFLTIDNSGWPGATKDPSERPCSEYGTGRF